MGRLAPRRGPTAWAAVLLAAIAVLLGLWSGPALAVFGASTGAAQQISTGTLQAPRELTAAIGTCVVATSVSVDLSWLEPLDPMTNGYEVWRSTDGGAFELVATISGRTATSHVDATAQFSTTYAYKVRSTRSPWTGPDSNTASITTPSSTCLL
ncbi:MAG: hypothetical protein M3N52_07395 [Actinomycetota bacterium]|nr:hypothetical protein [Actinomycetota bacterium]